MSGISKPFLCVLTMVGILLAGMLFLSRPENHNVVPDRQPSPPTVRELVSSLVDATPAISKEIERAILDRKDDVVPDLGEILRDEREKIALRTKAAQLLVRIDTERSFAALLSARSVGKDPDLNRRLDWFLATAADADDIASLRAVSPAAAAEAERKVRTQRDLASIASSDISFNALQTTALDPAAPAPTRLAAINRIKDADPEKAIPILSRIANQPPEKGKEYLQTTVLMMLKEMEDRR